MRLTEFCIRRPVFTTVLSLVIIVLGIVSYSRIPVRGYPAVNPPVITVTTNYDGASASIIESQITTPIENDLIGLSGLQSMHSISKQGYSRIILKYNLDVDINAAVDDVRNALAKIADQLPTDVDTPVIEKRDPNSLQTLVLTVREPGKTALQLTDYANRYLLPAFEQVAGVASAELYNERDYAMLISLNPALMAARGVTVSDLTQVLEAQNVNVPSGQIKSPSRYYSVLSEGELHDAKQFSRLIIRDQHGFLLHFGDIAKVTVGAEDSDSAMRINGHTAVGIGIYAQATANPIAVAQAVQHTLKKLQSSLPPGMKIVPAWNTTTYLQASLDKVYDDFLLAIILVVVVVLAFLGSWRSTLIPAVTIPICLVGVFALIYFLGYSINVFTLLALVLAIGLVVDDAIVMLENIYRYIEQGLSPFKAAIRGSGEIVFAIIAMTITLAAVYAPIGFATGMTGIVFRQFAFTLALAVLISGFVALTLSPMMSARLLKLPVNHSRFSYHQWLDRHFSHFIAYYRRFLMLLLKHRLWLIAVLVLIAGVGIWCFQTLPSELTPAEDMGSFLVKLKPPTNASFAVINQDSQAVENMIRHVSGVKSVMMMVDTDRGGFGFVSLKPWGQRDLSAKQIQQHILHQAKQIPGVNLVVFNPSTLGGGGQYGDAIQMVISTDQSFQALHQIAAHVIQQISQSPLVASADEDLEMHDKQYIVHLNRDLAAALKVNVADVTNTLKTMLGGSKVTAFDWDARDYDVVLQIPAQHLQNLHVINQLYVRNNAGKMIPLSSLVSIKQTVQPQQLPHEDRLRADTLIVQAAPGVAMGRVIQLLQHNAHKLLPNGVQFHFKGAARRFMDSRHTMMASFALAIIFIYLVLAAQFESFIDPLIILLTVPLSMVGALVTLKLTVHSLSIYTNIGFVTLVGLIAKHGILITEFANQRRREGMDLLAAVVDAAAQRLRPILMTTAAMVIGAIPLAFAVGPGALSRQHIGWVIVGGLLFGTFFSLIVVPVAYALFGKLKKISAQSS